MITSEIVVDKITTLPTYDISKIKRIYTNDINRTLDILTPVQKQKLLPPMLLSVPFYDDIVIVELCDDIFHVLSCKKLDELDASFYSYLAKASYLEQLGV